MIFTSIPGGVYMFVYKSRAFSYLYLLIFSSRFPAAFFSPAAFFFPSWDHIFFFYLYLLGYYANLVTKNRSKSPKKNYYYYEQRTNVKIIKKCLFYYFLVVDTMEGYEYSHYINNTGVTYIFHLSTVGSVIIFIIHVETKTQ